MNLLQAESSAESDARFRHLRDYVRSFSPGSANARIVKENHLMIRGKAVDYVRIPAIHVGVEVPQKKQRNRTRSAESAVGVADAVGRHKLCGGRFVFVLHLSIPVFHLRAVTSLSAVSLMNRCSSPTLVPGASIP